MTKVEMTKAVEIAEARRSRPLRRVYSGRARTIIERGFLAFKNSTWVVVLSGFVEPLLYLFSFGIGVGHLVGKIEVSPGHFVTYGQFIAPALLATSAMNGAIYESTWNVFFRLKHDRIYQGILATSMGPLDVTLGEIAWALMRGFIYAIGFTAVVMPFGYMKAPWGFLAIPAAVLIAFGFAALGMCYTTYATSFQRMQWVNVIMLPMFLFSGSLYPLSIYPTILQWVIKILPLYHGIEIIRSLALGNLHFVLIGHVLYFVAMIVGGLTFATQRLNNLFMR